MSDETRIEYATTDRRGNKTLRQRWVTLPGGEKRFTDLPAGEIAELLRKRSKLGEREAKLLKVEHGG